MSYTNDIKPTITAGVTWTSISTTWASETRVWAEMASGSMYTNDSKP